MRRSNTMNPCRPAFSLRALCGPLLLVVSQSLAQQAPTAATASLDIPSRMKQDQVFDGTGGYRMMQDDGVRSIQGLFALAERFGPKPYELLGDGKGNWASERVIFRDVDTGTRVMRLTNDRFADSLSYFQGNWTADGRFIVWRRRPGMWESSTATHGPMAMDADGTNMRNAFRDASMVEGVVCSPTRPDECYATVQRKQLVAYNVATGQRKQVVRDISGGWHLKVSMDGKYLINRGNTTSGQKGIWIVGTDGREYYDFPLPEPIHDSYRIDPVRKKVMFWYEGKFGTEGIVECDFDGSNKQKINVQFDWNHGDVGLDRGVHTVGYVTMIQPDGWGPKINLFGVPQPDGDKGMVYDNPPGFNGYTSWWPKDRLWTYNTRIPSKPFVAEIDEWSCEPSPDQYVNRYRVCYTAVGRGQTLDCPNTSPDGTKILFNSDMLGAADIYCAVARLPEAPTGLKIEPADSGVKLTWSPAAHHAETAGYHVYRSDEGGVNFRPLTDKPLAATGTQCILSGKDLAKYFYAVTAIEHSGLESDLSAEVTLAPNARHRVFLEAESAKLTPEMWVGFTGSASGCRYVWMRKRQATGTATISLDRAPDNAIVWARVKGKDGARFKVAAGSASAGIMAGPTDDWQWVKADAALPMKGIRSLELTSQTYGSAVDRFVLTDDASFDPAGAQRVVMPPMAAVAGVSAQAVSLYATRLSWQAVNAATFDHYNVYCGAKQDFAVNQATLVASPQKAELVDWGLRPGTSYYYAVTAVDRAGHEGPPATTPLAVTTGPIKPVMIEKPFSASLAFDAPEAGAYAVWLHLIRQPGSGVYLDVKVDNAGGSWVGTGDGLSETYWINYDRWGRFDLKAGAHMLTIGNKTPCKIDKVTITNDLSFRPKDDHVTSLSGW